jgi:uncharacterized protein (TIGR02611 family)
MIDHAIRIGRVLAGIILLVAGVAMLFLPGPGILAIFIGITFLAHEFHWARRVQSWMKNRYEHLKERIDGRREGPPG